MRKLRTESNKLYDYPLKTGDEDIKRHAKSHPPKFYKLKPMNCESQNKVEWTRSYVSSDKELKPKPRMVGKKPFDAV